MLERTNMSEKYEPDPFKLAAQCFYDEYQVNETIKQIQLKGAGRNMYTEKLKYILEEAIEGCRRTRDSWTFKREIVTEGDSDDDCSGC